MSFKLSYLNSNLALTLAYRNNSTLSSNLWPHFLIAKWLPLPVVWDF